MSPKVKPKLPIAIYTRVSEQGSRSNEELLSHDLQRTRVEKYLDAKGLTASPEEFKDNDRSGGSMSRPALDRIVAGIVDGSYGGLAVAYLDRFARNVPEALALIDRLERKGAAVIALDTDFDTSTAVGRATLTVILAFNALYREQAAEKAHYLADTKLDEGTSLGGTAPVGYEFEIIGHDEHGKALLGWYVRKEPEATIVELAFTKFASGELSTVGRVADFLNENGLTTSRDRPWKRQNTRGFLAREAYIGVRVYNRYGKDDDGKKIIVSTREVEGAHEAIVEPWLFRKVQAMLVPKGPTGPRVRGEGHTLGGGLIRCGKCGDGMTKGRANGKYLTLRCNGRGGGHASARYSLALDYIISTAFAHAGMTVREEGGNMAEVEAADGLIALAREALAEVEALRGTIAPASYAQAHSDASRGVELAEDARAELALDPGVASLIFPLGNKEAFEALSIPAQRDALHGLISRVVIAPGREHIGSRLSIEFADGSVWPAPGGTGAPVEVAA
jgi:DNA invertase Pin-like site-specific DNA recombinase